MRFLPKCRCIVPKTHVERIKQYVAELENLTRIQKMLLEERYTKILNDYERRSLKYTWMYNVMRIILVIGGISVPTLLSIQGTNYQTALFWLALSLSIAVGITTSLITVFKIDRKFFLLHTALEVMESEMHQFFGLTGKYATVGKHKRQATHRTQIQYLFYTLEKLRLSQVQQEYIHFSDTGKFGSKGTSTDYDTEVVPVKNAAYNPLNSAINNLVPPGSPGSPGPPSIQSVITNPQSKQTPIIPKSLPLKKIRRTRSADSIQSRIHSSRATNSEHSKTSDGSPIAKQMTPQVIGSIILGLSNTSINGMRSVSIGHTSDETIV